MNYKTLEKLISTGDPRLQFDVLFSNVKTLCTRAAQYKKAQNIPNI